MIRPKLEVADVFRSLDPAFVATLPAPHRRVVQDIVTCRTAALGGHLERCDQCGYSQIAYDSCRNRHCPKCQAIARAEWMEARAEELLEVEYFHVVFTLPEQLSPLALQNKRIIYNLLFKAASETLLEIAADRRHLGARIGFFAVLHSWGQTMQFHPHLHCVIPGGGLSADNSRWIACRPGFFLPVKVLSRLFRGKFVAFLREAREQGRLTYTGQLAALAGVEEFNRWLRELSGIEWVVYAKPPFGGPEQVLKYLARYTHRVAISNSRLLELKDNQVTFRYKDYAAGNLTKTMTLSVQEFTRRFLLHVLPRGLVRIRYYGFLANCCRVEKLKLCRRLIPDGKTGGKAPQTSAESDSETARTTCPSCRRGKMVIVEKIEALRGDDLRMTLSAPAANTS
jgi:Putative transposase/Transposase zinc-binding domain